MKNKKRIFFSICLGALLLAGCGAGQTETQTTVTGAPTVTSAPEATATPTVTSTPTPTATPTPTPTPMPSERVVLSEQEAFYTEDIQVELVFDTAQSGTIYYTLDGSTPDETSLLYEMPILLEAAEEITPSLYHLRAAARYEDGRWSETTAHTYFVGNQVSERYSTLIFSITGDASLMTEEPDGILYGDNVYNRGREYEIPVYIEALRADGSLVFEQFAGLRVYGGKSRGYALPSLKIYARKSYSPDTGTFPIAEFQTPRVDKPDKIVKKYDKLVLRNGGDDFQCAMIRDELSHMLAAQAGFTDYESVLPALVYLNGEYYALMWLHESYCDEYFQRKYGETAGEFIICEGAETAKSVSASDDEIEEAAAREYNAMYKKYAYADLTVDETVKELNQLLDIENYLKYYAYVLYGGTYDWPNRNYKCYRYYPAEGEEAGEGVYDGRWRFLIHDMDSSFGTHTTKKNIRYEYNDWADVLNKKHERYSPLFSALMYRKDCREFFVEYTTELMNTVYTYDSVAALLDFMHSARAGELDYYLKYLRKLRADGDNSVWATREWFDFFMEQTLTYATERPAYAKKYLQELLDSYTE